FLGPRDAGVPARLLRVEVRVDDALDAVHDRVRVEGLTVGELHPGTKLELPRRGVDLRRQGGREQRLEVALRVPGQQGLVDVDGDGPLVAVVAKLWIERRRLRPERDRDRRVRRSA